MAPIVNGLDIKYRQQVNFVYFDVGDMNNLPLRRELGLVATPHFFLLDPTGEVISQWIGVVPYEILDKAIQESITQP